MSENIFLQKDYVIGVIDRTINSVSESNSYRGRVNQPAQFTVDVLESVRNEIIDKGN